MRTRSAPALAIALITTLALPVNLFGQLSMGTNKLLQDGKLVGFVWVCDPNVTPGCLPRYGGNTPLWIDYVEHFCLFETYRYPGQHPGDHLDFEPVELFPTARPEAETARSFRALCRDAAGKYVRTLVTEF